MIEVIVLLVIAGAIASYYYLSKDLNLFKKHGIPHMTPLPLLGNIGPLLFRRQSMTELIKSMYDLHPDAKYIGMYDSTHPLVLIRDLELIKSITLKNFDIFMDHRIGLDENQDKLFGRNLFALCGKKWREMRPILSPSFTTSKMKYMFKLMTDCGDNFSNYLVKLSPEKRIMDMKDIFTRYTNDVIATCAFGINVDSMKNPKNDFYVYGKEITKFNIITMIKFYISKNLPWLGQMLKLRIIRQEIAVFFQDLVETTIKTRDEKGIVRPDMLQLLMETRRKDGKVELSIDDIVSQAFIFFIAGFDSTSTLMCFAAHEIGVNQNVQERLQNEIDQVLKDMNGQAPYEAINAMEYLDAVINEALRMYPIAPFLDRKCLENFELPPTLPGTKTFTLKKGQGVWIPVYGLHHDPQYFEEPEKFDPERFLGERKKTSLNCGAYLPFGLGPRMCIGNRFALLEMKILFFHLLARCDLKPCEKTSIPIKFTKDGFNVRPEGGVWLNVVPRKNTHYVITTNDAKGPR